jgi:hypothetical protein
MHLESLPEQVWFVSPSTLETIPFSMSKYVSIVLIAGDFFPKRPTYAGRVLTIQPCQDNPAGLVCILDALSWQ